MTARLTRTRLRRARLRRARLRRAWRATGSAETGSAGEGSEGEGAAAGCGSGDATTATTGSSTAGCLSHLRGLRVIGLRLLQFLIRTLQLSRRRALRQTFLGNSFLAPLTLPLPLRRPDFPAGLPWSVLDILFPYSLSTRRSKLCLVCDGIAVLACPSRGARVVRFGRPASAAGIVDGSRRDYSSTSFFHDISSRSGVGDR